MKSLTGLLTAMIVSSIFLASVASFTFPQEESLVPGAWRGPYFEVFSELAVQADRTTPSSTEPGEESPAAPARPVDGWDRWEFWFEHEQRLLFRGPAESPPRVLGEDARYGKGDSSYKRDDFREAAIPFLIDALRSPDAVLRESGALALGRIGESQARGSLLEAAQDEVPQVRQAALLALGLLHEPRAIGPLAEILADRNQSIAQRSFAALAIGLSGRPEGATYLKQFLKANLTADRLVLQEGDIVLSAAWAAGAFPEAGFATMFIEAISKLEQTAATASRRTRFVLIQALGNIGDPVAAPFLRGALTHHDIEIRRAAAQALGRLRSPRGVIPSLLSRVKEDTDLETRMFALIAIGRIGGDEAEKAFVEIKDDVRRHRQLHAAWSLAAGFAQADALRDGIQQEFLARKPKEGVSETVTTLRRDEERLRGAMALSLGLFADEKAEPAILQALELKGIAPDFAGYLFQSCGYVDTKACHNKLIAAVDEKHSMKTGRGLAWGLGLSTHPDAGAVLAKLLVKSAHDEVRWAAAHALSEVRSRPALQEILKALSKASQEDLAPEKKAHLIMALGVLGDIRQGDGLASYLAGMNYRSDFPLLKALRSY